MYIRGHPNVQSIEKAATLFTMAWAGETGGGGGPGRSPSPINFISWEGLRGTQYF